MERLFWLVWHFVSHRWTRYAAAWLAVLGATAGLHHEAWHGYDDRNPDLDLRRRDGNDGHRAIDFSGQWLMGRMLVRGYGRKLYSRAHLHEVAVGAYPRSAESPTATTHDADEIVVNWFVSLDKAGTPQADRADRARNTRGSFMLPLAAADPFQATGLVAACGAEVWTSDRLREVDEKRIAGPLYPPTQAFLFAPLALGDHPQQAYRVTQCLMLGMAYVCGLGVSVLTRRKIWWPVATALVVYYPGFAGAHYLGQNGPLSLAILIWGWVLVARNREGWAGVLWGLLVYKPVWGLAFFLVPVLTRRWRMAFAMAATAVLIALATLPFVGLEPWLDWLKVGKVASETYDVDPSWIPLSRDLLGIPRRFLVNFEDPYFQRDRWYIQVAGWGLLVLVLEATVRLTQLLKIDWRATSQPAAAFVLLGAWLCCFHFMYYDVLLSALGFVTLLADPGKFARPVFARFGAPAGGAWAWYLRPRLARAHPGLAAPAALEAPMAGSLWVVNSLILYALAALIVIHTGFSYLGISASFQAARFPPRTATVTSQGGPVNLIGKDGLPVERTPKLEVTTNQAGPAWDTLVLLGMWAWAGAYALTRFALGQKEGTTNLTNHTNKDKKQEQ